MDYFGNLCPPAALYAILGIMSVVLSALFALKEGKLGSSIFELLFSLIITLIFTVFFGYICNRFSEGAVWFILIILLVMNLTSIAFALGLALNKQQFIKN